MRFLHCMYGLLNFCVITKNYPPILNTRFTPPLFKHCEHDKFYYGSQERKRFKDLEGLRFLVQDHHCIPYQYRNHKLLIQTNFNVNCSRNILMMPTRLGIKELNLHPNTLIHDGGHPAYNKFIGKNSFFCPDKKILKIWEKCNSLSIFDGFSACPSPSSIT